MVVSDSIRWHIAMKEKTSMDEAFYIHCLIKYYEMKLNENYKVILDIPCGNGRLSYHLLKFGYEVYGVDISEELIKEARERMPSDSNKFFVGDMRYFYIDRNFDVVLNWFTSFGYFDDIGNIETIRNFNKLLRENGLLILETFNPLISEKFSLFFDYGDILELCEIKVEKNYRIFNKKFYEKLPNSLKFLEEREEKVRIYTVEEFKEMIRNNGFELLKVYETLTFKDYIPESNRIVYVAIKKKDI